MVHWSMTPDTFTLALAMRTIPATVTLICAWHFCLATAVKHGIIGMGINMYRPFCCNACTDSLSPLFLNCTLIIDGVGNTSPACRASSEPWLQHWRTASSTSAQPTASATWRSRRVGGQWQPKATRSPHTRIGYLL
jgi:hypothetical protein